MIRAVRCDQPSFRTVDFQPGLNVVLAERTKASTTKDSRNGLGKTTLVEIIHFCLGSNATKGRGLLKEPLSGWTFSLDSAHHPLVIAEFYNLLFAYRTFQNDNLRKKILEGHPALSK